MIESVSVEAGLPVLSLPVLLLMYVLILKFFPIVSLVLRDTYKYTNIKRIYSKYINYAIINVYLNHTITAIYHSRLQKYRGSHALNPMMQI